MSTRHTSIDALLGEAAWLQRLARSLAGDEGEDLVQETWISALRTRVSADRSVRPWLGRVLTNHAITRLRAAARREARHVAARDVVVEAPDLNPEACVSRLEAQRLLAGLVAELPEPLRQTVLLRFYEGLNATEIGRVMGAPPGTVRRRLKHAIEELRSRLDARHEGARERWLAALAPFGSQGIPRTWQVLEPVLLSLARLQVSRSWAAVISMLAILLLGGGWLWRTISAGPTPDRAGPLHPALGAPDAGQPPDHRRTRTAAHGHTPAILADCQARLSAVGAEIAKLDETYRKVARPAALFQDGTPNPEAAAVLSPIVEKALRGDGGAASSFTLECRTWSCKMTLLLPAGATWSRQFTDHPELKGRFAGRSFENDFPTKDPLSGEALTQSTFYLGLANPSAAAVPQHARRTTTPDTLAVPDDLGACERALAAAEDRLSRMRKTVANDPSPLRRFERGAPNPSLAAQFQAVIEGIFRAGGKDWKPAVECRDQACRVEVSVPGSSDSWTWREPLWKDALFRRWITAEAVDRDRGTTYGIGDPTRPQGGELVQKVLDDLRASPALASCYARHREDGRLQARFSVPDLVDMTPNDDGDMDRIGLRLGGTLAGTPLGTCVEQELRQSVLSTKLPARTRGATVHRGFVFPIP